MVQLNLRITDVKGPTNFICYWRIFLIANVIIYRLPEKGAQIDSLFLAVVCNNLSRIQSTKTLRIDFLFSFSLIDPSKHCSPSTPSICLSLLRLSVLTDIFSRHFTSSVMYFLSFYVIRDVFSPISHHISHCIASTVYLQFYLK